MNENILVVSNIDIIFNRIKLLFNKSYDCCLCSSCDEAKEFIHKSSSPTSLIFVDDDNLQTNIAPILDKICHIVSDIPVIFLSSFYDKTIINTIKRRQTCHCIVKPFNNKTIIDKIVSILGELALKVFKKKAGHFIMSVDEKGSIGAYVLIEIQLSDKKYQPIENETVIIEVYNNPGTEVLFVHTNSKGITIKSLEIHKRGKVTIIAYMEDNPNFEKTATLLVDDTEMDMHDNDNVSNTTVLDGIKQTTIFLFTTNNIKYNSMISNINYDVHGTIKSLNKIAEIININRKEDLPIIEKQYSNKNNIIILDTSDTLQKTNEVIIIKDRFAIDNDFLTQEISKRLHKWSIIS